jgi:hypothetical protein
VVQLVVWGVECVLVLLYRSYDEQLWATFNFCTQTLTLWIDGIRTDTHKKKKIILFYFNIIFLDYCILYIFQKVLKNNNHRHPNEVL